MNKSDDIYSVEYYLPKNTGPAVKKTLPKRPQLQNFKILVQDDVKNSVYLIDA